jgi:membrane protease YdiL (CAAX protease family)
LIKSGMPDSAPQSPISQTESLVRRIFVGLHGLRAGWGSLVFMALLTLLGAGTYGLVRILPLPPFDSGGPVMRPFSKGIVEAVLFMIVVIATSIMALLERRKLSDYGFGLRKVATRFLSGAGCGFVFISLLIFVLFASHHVTLEHLPVPLGSAFLNGVEWFVSMFFVGAFEETLFRGYLQWTLGRGMTFWGASLLLAVLFGVSHGSNSGESHVGLVSAAMLGLVFSISIWYTQSIWWAIGFHAAWNWGMTFFYGTPNSGLLAAGHFLSIKPRGASIMSGGSTGPEGSVFMFPIVLLVTLVIYLTYRPKFRLNNDDD